MTCPCKHCDELSGSGSTYLVGWLVSWCIQWHSEMQLDPKLMFRIVFWDVLPCKMIVDRRTSETSVDNYFTRQYIPEDNSEHHTRRRENFKSHRTEVIRTERQTLSSKKGVFLGSRKVFSVRQDYSSVLLKRPLPLNVLFCHIQCNTLYAMFSVCCTAFCLHT
jgi:hypothetical protein